MNKQRLPSEPNTFIDVWGYVHMLASGDPAPFLPQRFEPSDDAVAALREIAECLDIRDTLPWPQLLDRCVARLREIHEDK